MGEALQQPVAVEESPARMLGALVPDEVYWDFKKACGARKETMQEAIYHAAMMYITAKKGDE